MVRVRTTCDATTRCSLESFWLIFDMELTSHDSRKTHT
jgi:hypothetical protein